MAKNNTIARVFLIGILALIIYASYIIFQSFLVEFLVAAILSTTFYGPYKRLLKFFHGRAMLASLVMCSLIILLVIVPLVNILIYSSQRLVIAYNNSEEFFNQENLDMVTEKLMANPLVNKALFFVADQGGIKNYLFAKAQIVKDWLLSGAVNDFVLSGSKSIITGTASIFFSIIIVIFCMFFFFIDGEKMIGKIMYWTPLPNKHDRAIFKKFKDVSYSTIISTFITALVQGFIGAIGFLIISFPIFFPAIILAFASIIPYVGTALIWIPISLYLLAIGNIWQGVFLIVWGAVVIGNSDNLIRTYLIKDKAEVHPLFIFFSILGGLSVFGFWGLVFGPLIISVAVTILHIYEIEFAEVLEK